MNTVIPETHVFRWGKLNRSECQALVDSFNREAAAGNMANVWIVKPSGGGKGKDIEVVRGCVRTRALMDCVACSTSNRVLYVLYSSYVLCAYLDVCVVSCVTVSGSQRDFEISRFSCSSWQ